MVNINLEKSSIMETQNKNNYIFTNTYIHDLLSLFIYIFKYTELIGY